MSSKDYESLMRLVIDARQILSAVEGLNQLDVQKWCQEASVYIDDDLPIHDESCSIFDYVPRGCNCHLQAEGQTKKQE